MGSLSVNDFVKEVKAILQNKHTTLRFKSEAVLKLSNQLSNTKYYVFIHIYIMQNFKTTQKIDFTPSEINDVTPAKVNMPEPVELKISDLGTADYFKIKDMYDKYLPQLKKLSNDDLKVLLIRNKAIRESVKKAKAAGDPYITYFGFVMNIQGTKNNNELTFNRFMALVGLFNILEGKNIITSLGSQVDLSKCGDEVKERKHFICSGVEYFLRMKIDNSCADLNDIDYAIMYGFVIVLDYLGYYNMVPNKNPTIKPLKIVDFLKDKKIDKYALLRLTRNCGYGTSIVSLDEIVNPDHKFLVVDIMKNAEILGRKPVEQLGKDFGAVLKIT